MAGGGAGLRKRRGRGGEEKGRGEVEGGKGRAPKVTVEPGPLRALLRHCLELAKSSQVISGQSYQLQVESF